MRHFIKRPLFILSLITLTTFGCSSDDDKIFTNSFSFENEEYDINFAFTQNSDDSIIVYLTTNSGIITGNYTGELSFVGILFQTTTLSSGTYSFKSTMDPDFDNSLHFSDGEAGVMVNYIDGDPDGAFTIIQNLIGGSVTIRRDGDTNYRIEFNLEFDEGMFNGNYSGVIENIL